MSELPDGWIVLPLAEAIQPRGEKVIPADYPAAKFIGMDHVESQTTRIMGSVPALEMKSSAARFYAGDVLYGRLRPYLNKVAQPNFNGLASAEFIVFPDTPLVHSAYLKYRLNARDFVSFASHLNEGDRPRVGFEQIGKFNLLIPPANEQKRIVAKIEELLSELDQGIESLKTARAQLKVYRQSILKHAFEGKLTADWRVKNKSTLESIDKVIERIPSHRRKNLDDPAGSELGKFPELPLGWKYTRLGYFIDSIGAGKSFKCDEREPNQEEIGVAKVSAVTWGEYDEHESKTCLDSDKVRPEYFIKPGDFLFSRANTIELVGACVIVKAVTKKVMLSDKTLRVNFGNLDPYYFLYYLRSQMGRNEIMGRSTGNQESMRNIGQDRIRNIIVPVCSPLEAGKITQEIQEKFSIIENMESTIEIELQKSEALHQSILKKAFSGQLVAQDPADEPASILLERIRAEKEKASDKKPKTKRRAA